MKYLPLFLLLLASCDATLAVSADKPQESPAIPAQAEPEAPGKVPETPEQKATNIATATLLAQFCLLDGNLDTDCHKRAMVCAGGAADSARVLECGQAEHDDLGAAQ